MTSAATNYISNVNDDPSGSLALLGTAKEGHYLNVINSVTDLDGYSNFAYQWLRQGKVILGANSTEYLLTQADVASKISLKISYTDEYGHDETITSPETTAIENTNNTPNGAFILGGTASVGKLLIADFQINDPDGLGSKTYAWYSDATKLEGETAQSLLVTDQMLDKSIKVVITFIDGFGTVEEITSIKSDPVSFENSDPIGAAEIIGRDTEGQLLTTDVQITDADGLGEFSYQWYRDSSPLIGETNEAYSVTRTDVGKNTDV